MWFRLTEAEAGRGPSKHRLASQFWVSLSEVEVGENLQVLSDRLGNVGNTLSEIGHGTGHDRLRNSAQAIETGPSDFLRVRLQQNQKVEAIRRKDWLDPSGPFDIGDDPVYMTFGSVYQRFSVIRVSRIEPSSIAPQRIRQLEASRYGPTMSSRVTNSALSVTNVDLIWITTATHAELVSLIRSLPSTLRTPSCVPDLLRRWGLARNG